MSKFSKKQQNRFGRLNFNYSKHVHMVLFKNCFVVTTVLTASIIYPWYGACLILYCNLKKRRKNQKTQKKPQMTHASMCVFVNIVNNVPRGKYLLLKFSINKCLSICFLNAQCIKRSRSFIRHIHLIRSTLIPNYIPHSF